MGDGNELDTATFSAKHPFVRALADSTGIFSLRELREVFQAVTQMEERVNANSDTLRELLRLKGPPGMQPVSTARRAT